MFTHHHVCPARETGVHGVGAPVRQRRPVVELVLAVEQAHDAHVRVDAHLAEAESGLDGGHLPILRSIDQIARRS